MGFLSKRARTENFLAVETYVYLQSRSVLEHPGVSKYQLTEQMFTDCKPQGRNVLDIDSCRDLLRNVESL